jgi:hypothetical protein
MLSINSQTLSYGRSLFALPPGPFYFFVQMKLRWLLLASRKCGALLQQVSLGGGICPFGCAPKVQCQQVFPLSDFVHEISKKTINEVITYFISYFFFFKQMR